MYEHTGHYYAFFGPNATVTPQEEQFLAHWSDGRHCALDFGAGLCGPALVLARLGMEVFAFEPSPVIAALAMDRLSRENEPGRSITLLEGPTETLAEPFKADFVLVRSVFMLLSAEEREVALQALGRHTTPGTRMILDVRTSSLQWVEQGRLVEERNLGRTLYRRRTVYTRQTDGATRVHWGVETERSGHVANIAKEELVVRADTLDHLQQLLAGQRFQIEQVYGAYDLGRPYADGDAMIVAVAQRM